MRSYKEIFDLAAERKGGAAALRTQIQKPVANAALKKIPDDRWLAEMTRRIFQAGFNWEQIDKKWPAFEEAFWRFAVGRCALMSDEDLDGLVADAKIVRNAKKILTVRDNAVFLRSIAAEHGSAGAFFADWPRADYVGLLQLLKKRGSYLSGSTAQYFLRFMGVDSVVFSRDVVAALIREGVVDKAPTSQKDLKACQSAFDQWIEDGAGGLTEISRVLALGIDAPAQ